MKKINKPVTDLTPYGNRKPIKIEGEPLSETIVKEKGDI